MEGSKLSSVIKQNLPLDIRSLLKRSCTEPSSMAVSSVSFLLTTTWKSVKVWRCSAACACQCCRDAAKKMGRGAACCKCAAMLAMSFGLVYFETCETHSTDEA